MRFIHRISSILLLFSIAFVFSVKSEAQATQKQIEEGNAHLYRVFDTHPVVLYGPFLLDTTETSTTIEWITDTPCQSKVEYGESNLDQEATPQKDGLIPVGTLQRVELKGLLPGHLYHYQIESTRVVRLKPYWPDKGLSVKSSVYSFSTFDRKKPATSFSVVTDTHEDVSRIHALMQMIDWKTTDFLVHEGDGVNYADNQNQLFDNWLEPISEGLAHTKPLIYARGNHEMRGPFARELSEYLAPAEGHFYFIRNDGPVHLIVLDTGEDKPDDNKAYSGLNALAPYREEEYAWLRKHVESDKDMADAPFRIILMHQPLWGWVNGEEKKWTDLANQGKVDLVIAGHFHKFMHIQPGQHGNKYPILVIGQDQVARVDATADQVRVTVTARNGTVLDSFTLPRRSGKP